MAEQPDDPEGIAERTVIAQPPASADRTIVETKAPIAKAPDAPDGPRLVEPGTLINNNYRILSLVNAGGMGEVYRAENVFTGDPVDVGGLLINRGTFFIIAALVVCWAFLWWFVNKTGTGRAMQAVSQDPDTARLMGINVDKAIATAFAVGAALAAVAGMAHGLRYNNIDFQMGFMAGMKAFTAAVLGGIGNINGAVVGGLTLGVVEAMATAFMPGQFGGPSWKDVWAFVLLILILVFRPQGLVGAKVVDRA